MSLLWDNIKDVIRFILSSNSLFAFVENVFNWLKTWFEKWINYCLDLKRIQRIQQKLIEMKQKIGSKSENQVLRENQNKSMKKMKNFWREFVFGAKT